MLKELAASTGADVAFAGYLSGDKLFSLIGRSRGLILPSEWFENAPISLLEAYALGRPVIGAAIGGIPEMIREGETGFTAKSGDAEDLARVMVNLASRSSGERAAMGRVGRDWISTEFSRSAYRQRMLDLYHSLKRV
jgi:glycosyltransferase involved in cell wall biosynthesis